MSHHPLDDEEREAAPSPPAPAPPDWAPTSDSLAAPEPAVADAPAVELGEQRATGPIDEGPAGSPTGEEAPQSASGPASAVWGCVDEHGAIWQRGGRRLPDRVVGHLRDAAPEAALRAFEERFRRLEQSVAQLEADPRAAERPAHLGQVLRLAERVRTASAVGDFDALLARLELLERQALAARAVRRERKEQICVEAERERASTDWKPVAERLRALQQEWKTLGSVGREDDAVLWRRFKGALDEFFHRREADLSRRIAQRREAQGRKESLCVRAEEGAKSTDWRRATELFSSLMQEWKLAGSAGRQLDQALWRRFSAARAHFFSQRAAHRRELRRAQDANRERKEALCAAAEALAQAVDVFAAAEEAKRLQAEWRTVGPAPASVHETLWQRFRTACGSVFDRIRAERTRRRTEWQASLRTGRERRAEQLAALRDSIDRDREHLERWRDSLARLRGGGMIDQIRGNLEQKIADVTSRLPAKEARLRELELELRAIESKLRTEDEAPPADPPLA